MQTTRSHRTRILLALALAVVLAGLLWPSRARRRAVAAPADPEDSTSGSTVARPPVPVEAPGPRPTVVAAPPTPEPPPVIDEITVEKPAVCSGEENLVTVRAHTVNGTDEFLHTVVDGAMGSSVPLRLLLGEDGRVEGQHVISVFGRGNVAVTVPVPSYTVKDCQPERAVVVEPRVVANTWGDFELLARVVSLPPPGPGIRSEGAHRPFEAVSYSWTFGDGEAATTTGPRVSHDYQGRTQDALYSYFTIRVDVRDASGQTLTGRTTLPLINQAFEAYAQKGVVQLLVALDPRFPELGPDGRVVQSVRLWHTRAQPVTIDAAAVTRYFEGAAGESGPQPVAVTALLGTTIVPPGKDGITTSVVLDTITDPGVFSMTYRLSGHAPDGHPVMGSFSVMRPPARPTADNSQVNWSRPGPEGPDRRRARDPRQGPVNDEDLWQLERQGRFADLPSSSDAPALPRPVSPTPRPPAMPDPGLPARGPPVPAGVTPAPTATMPERETAPTMK